MSFTKARERQLATTGDTGFDHSMLCRMPGCRNRWTVDINHGRVCSLHDETLSRVGIVKPSGSKRLVASTPIPLRDAVRPFAEPVEPEEEQF